MKEDDIQKLRDYISKKHKYDFKQPIDAFIYETEITKESVVRPDGKKRKVFVEKKIPIPVKLLRAIISFVPSDNPPRLLYMYEIRKDIKIGDEEIFHFN